MITLAVTIGLAFVGDIATYINGLGLTQRQERLGRVNLQLSNFYGPLLALTEANGRVFNAFVDTHARPGGVSPFADETPPTEKELADWRLWVTTVFLPNIQAMRQPCDRTCQPIKRKGDAAVSTPIMCACFRL